MKQDSTFFSKLSNYLVNSLYLNDRRKFSLILVGVFGSFSMIIFMSYVGLHLEFNLKTAAWLITLLLASRNIYQIVLRIPLGHFSQMIGRKPLLIAGISFYTISLGFLAISFHWGLVLVAIAFLAIGMSCFWPVLFAYLGDIENENIGQLQGRIFQGTDLGTLFGSGLAFILLDTFQVAYRTLFAWGFGISLLGVVIMIFIMPEVLKDEDKLATGSKIKALAESFLLIFKNLYIVTKQKKLNFIYTMQLVIAFMEYMVTVFFPFLVVSKPDLFDEDVSFIFLISICVLIFFRPYLGKIIDKIGYKIPMLFTVLTTACMLFLMAYVTSLAWLIVVYIIYGASSLTSYIAVNTGTTRESQFNQRGMALGALGFYVSISRSVSTLSLTPVWENSGVNSVFIVTGIIVISATLLIYLVFFFLERNNRKKGNL